MKPPFDEGDIILSRTFERDDGSVLLQFMRPVQYPMQGVALDPDNPPWRCDYVVRFPGDEIESKYAVGIDSIQALLLAFAGAKHRLQYACDGTPARRPPIRWLEQDDLGLTIKHFDGQTITPHD